MFRVYFGFKRFENFQKLLPKLLSSTLPKDGIKPRPCGPSLFRVDRAYCQFVVPHFGGRHIVRFRDCLIGFFLNCSYQPIRGTFWVSNKHPRSISKTHLIENINVLFFSTHIIFSLRLLRCHQTWRITYHWCCVVIRQIT